MEDVGFDYLAKVKRNVGKFKAGGVYWCGSKYINFDSFMADKYHTGIIPKFNGQDKLLLVRGGIGDLLALSVLHDVAKEVLVITNRDLYPILDWWGTPPKRKNFNEPIWMVKYPKKIEHFACQYGQCVGDELIAQGSRENWYDVILRGVGSSSGRRRPQLCDKGPDGLDRFEDKSILIIHKATSINRTADLESLVSAVPEEFAGDICWYDDDRQLVVNGEAVPGTTSLNQYLADLYYAHFVVSVDTSAIHFREGISKPALGVYSSFSAASRTSGYEFTRSIDISSPCEIQPCFLNFKPCPVSRSWDKHAPCLGPMNKTFIKQVKTELCNYLKHGASAWLAMSSHSVTP